MPLAEPSNSSCTVLAISSRYRHLGHFLSEGPYGSIRWPADTDKEGRESCVPISPTVRQALDRVLRDRPGIGSAPLFPKPTDRALPLTIHLASKWLREGEKLAGLQTQKGSLWPYTVENGSRNGSTCRTWM